MEDPRGAKMAGIRSRVLKHPSEHIKVPTTCSHAGYPVADGGVHSDREPDCDDVTHGADPAHRADQLYLEHREMVERVVHTSSMS